MLLVVQSSPEMCAMLSDETAEKRRRNLPRTSILCVDPHSLLEVEPSLQGMEELSLWHLPLIGYFILIASLLLVIKPRIKFSSSNSSSSLLFVLLGVASTYFTWKYMLRYMAWSKREAAVRAGVRAVTSKEWLQSTSLFQEAWLQVCTTTTAWWWSEQLCLWTVGSLTIMMAIEGIQLCCPSSTLS